ncbi:FabD/lysophospholipase-like protein [Westerdykella ornata]|uniref:FabD/lysophospholipase-like protein n=1 Tax=Westerdykella ornata TaxID=318751 RepID=A0A6A6JVA7_WESOR|nr:FabD/lysophospholipase-like protein [Westerdykella ornata]KAF2278979.1 FabD/lysophospholipase-like protein [Westerdykella ornata]
MQLHPWITFEPSPGGKAITKHAQSAFPSSLNRVLRPAFVTCVGRRAKATVLQRMLGVRGPIPTHNQVCLWSSSRLHTGRVPIAIIDCEIQGSDPSVMPPTTPDQRTSSWQLAPTDPRHLGTLLCNQVFAPFSRVLCYFATDIGGQRATAKWLAEQATDSFNPALDLQHLPQVLIVVDTTSETFDETLAKDRFCKMLLETMQELGVFQDAAEVQHNINNYFADVKVLGLKSSMQLPKRAKAVKQRLVAMCKSDSRPSYQRFSLRHVEALSTQLLKAACLQSTSTFSFATASRPCGFSLDSLESCLVDFLSQLPSQAWLWHFLAPLLGSALLLSSYPPDSHSAIQTYTQHADVQDRFLKAVKAELQSRFLALTRSSRLAAEIHNSTLQDLHPHFAEFKSHRSCFCCFMRMPEKVLVCGHALCDICIKIYGRRSQSEKNTFELPACILCGVTYGNSAFRFVPPTAGIRVLSIDGGGIRGVIPLVFLKHIETMLSQLGCPIRDYFDFVCGTSAGGLVVLGMFLLQWSTCDSIDRFEDIASKTFGERNKTSTILARAFQYLVAYIEDGQYSLSAIQEAFRATIDAEIKMFNPLRNDTKVAVTTTNVGDSAPQLFTNYNGKRRPVCLGYDVLRAETAQDDVTVTDAACCTSAAPWFFRPYAVRSLGTFQDGGLQHNNPASIAQWEMRFIWPNKDPPDFTLSLGTGTTMLTNSCKDKERFYVRLFRSFMRSLDGEDAWKRFFNSLPTSLRHRYHRLNIFLPGQEPRLDDVAKIAELKTQTAQAIIQDIDTAPVLDSMIASLFYFELDDFPNWSNGTYSCSGHIMCRIDLPADGRHYLYRRLCETSSWFIIQGCPVQCVEYLPTSLPPFRRLVEFSVETLDELLAISLRGITTSARQISGFPVTVQNIINAQQLERPFGSATHARTEKVLPAVPAKRAYNSELCYPSHRRRIDR